LAVHRVSHVFDGVIFALLAFQIVIDSTDNFVLVQQNESELFDGTTELVKKLFLVGQLDEASLFGIVRVFFLPKGRT
jgi:hypothetical protein